MSSHCVSSSMRLASASRKWVGDIIIMSGLHRVISIDSPRVQLPANQMCHYSVLEKSPVHQIRGSEALQGFVGLKFRNGDGPVTMKPGISAFKILVAGTAGLGKDGNLYRECSPSPESQHYNFTRKQSGSSTSMSPELFGFSNRISPRENRGLKDIMILPKGTIRGLKKSALVPPHVQKSTRLRLYMGSPGVIGEPYQKPQPPLPILRRWFTREGWERRKQSIMGMIKTSYTIAKLRQKSKGYSQNKFYQEASDLYKQINIALAEGERSTLRQLVTDSVLSVMKNELKHREAMWAKVNWEMVGPIKKIRTMQGRLIGVDKNNHDNAFVQMTLKILSRQKFAAYDKRGNLVAGDPNKEILVEDYWVFEKPLQLTETKWRLCGRLSV